MKKIVVLLSSCLAAVPVFADYEPFSYLSGSGLIGQGNWDEVNAGNASDTAAGPTIGSANLSYAGLATSGGGSASFGPTANSESANMVLSSSVSSSSIYFSYELQLTSAGSLSTTPEQLTAFTQLTGGKVSTSLPTRGSVVVVEDNGSGTGFYIGMMRGGQNGNTPHDESEIEWIGGGSGATASGTLFSYDVTLLIVGDWNFSPTTTDDDTADLWVDPDASTFGAVSAPSGNITADDSGLTTDLTKASSIMLIQDTDAPDGEIDDLRIGTTWADVTPVAVPEPSTLAMGALGLAGFCLMRFRRK